MPESGRRVALVTGGSSGIGYACATMLEAAGYELVLVARTASRLKDAATSLNAAHHVANCAVEDEMRDVARAVGRVDLLVHAAGRLTARRARSMRPGEFREVLDDNLLTAYTVADAFVHTMTEGSRFVLIASTAALDGTRYLAAYGAAKAGVRAMAATLRDELEDQGVGVHVVFPGTVDTEMMRVTAVRRPALLAEDVASGVLWLDSLPVRVRVDELIMRPSESSPASHFIEPQ